MTEERFVAGRVLNYRTDSESHSVESVVAGRVLIPSCNQLDTYGRATPLPPFNRRGVIPVQSYSYNPFLLKEGRGLSSVLKEGRGLSSVRKPLNANWCELSDRLWKALGTGGKPDLRGSRRAAFPVKQQKRD